MEKNELRKQFKRERDLLSEEDLENNSKLILNHLLKDTPFCKSKCVLSYVDYKNEVKTDQLINYCLKKNIKVATPKVNNDEMDFFYIESYKDLEPGAYGILEPTTNQLCIPDQDTVVIMPGLVFDFNGGRIGYGGGYYDRYLNQYKNLLKIAVCYDFQIIDHIQCEDTDIKPDYIVTEKRVFKINKKN